MKFADNRDAGNVAEEINAAKSCKSFASEMLDRRTIADITLHRDGFGAQVEQFGSDVLSRFGLQISDDEFRALPRQRECEASGDTARAAGDHGDAITKVLLTVDIHINSIIRQAK